MQSLYLNYCGILQQGQDHTSNRELQKPHAEIWCFPSEAHKQVSLLTEGTLMGIPLVTVSTPSLSESNSR